MPISTAPDTRDRLRAAITDRYLLGRELGRGGMATVYLAQDRKHDRSVAVKVLHPELGPRLGAERFQREIRLAAQLQHPNILPVYDSGAGDGLLWFTMPYVEGDSLRRRLRRAGALPVDEAAAVLLDLARALGYAHRRGVIHRDVKPENVMVGDDCVLLADFGVARPLDTDRDSQLTGVGVMVGTPMYMAPEQASAEGPVDHRADLYALGVLAYELLAGIPPFTGLELAPLLVAHAIRDPQPLTTLRPEIPAALADIVARCLRKNPADRWSSADALAQALRAFGAAGSSGVITPVRDPSDSNAAALEDLEAARAALERGRWREAYVRFSAAGAIRTLEAEDLQRLAEAAWWVAEGAACVRAREQAYRRYLERGETGAAASVALALAEDHFHRLARAVGQGWLRRAEEHLEGLPESAAHGWLARIHMQIALDVRGDHQSAMGYADRVLAIARRVGDTDLEALAIQDRGRILVALGRVPEGMALIDQAMTFATAGELTPLAAGRAYCNMMSTCERLGDYGRAAEWHEAAHQWTEQHAESAFPGICQVHHAGMLRLRGALPEAEELARRAAEELGEFLRDVAGAAFYELGLIRLSMGDHARADAMFAEAHARGREPQPGLALLRLAEGKGEAARAMVERALAEPGLDALARAKLLPAMVEIAIHCGANDAAESAAAELEAIVATYGTPALVASAAQARGAVLLAQGEAAAALDHLRRARRTWLEIDLPFELARTRLLLARAHAALGEGEAAAMEERAALAITSRIAASSRG
jgi:tRNA A-37 threonylcarbamoyl transferase component Bud32/tetratricopeptide (TPR) repeat protein